MTMTRRVLEAKRYRAVLTVQPDGVLVEFWKQPTLRSLGAKFLCQEMFYEPLHVLCDKVHAVINGEYPDEMIVYKTARPLWSIPGGK